MAEGPATAPGPLTIFTWGSACGPARDWRSAPESWCRRVSLRWSTGSGGTARCNPATSSTTQQLLRPVRHPCRPQCPRTPGQPRRHPRNRPALPHRKQRPTARATHPHRH